MRQLLGSNSLAEALLPIQCGVLQPRLLLPLANAIGETPNCLKVHQLDVTPDREDIGG